jgi:ubiquinone/menaquinone biosynthesis C-methylase UbiE
MVGAAMSGRRSIPAEVYDREYLLSDNVEGFDEFRDGTLSLVKQRQIEELRLHPDVELLEVGVGRGEFLRKCAESGARVTGIDYSPDAIEITREIMSDFPDTELRVADCRDLPFEDDCFDRVCSGDVIEHVDAIDGVTMLQEMYRVVRPGGFMLVHTAPNTVFTRGVYPLVKPILRMIDSNAVKVLEEHMQVNIGVHVNEYNLLTLRRAAKRAGLAHAKVWIHADLLRSGAHRHTRSLEQHPFGRLAARLGALAPVRFFLGNDLFIQVEKPAS